MHTTRFRLGLALLLGALLATSAATAGAKTNSFNEKFEFNGVTLTDGTQTFENATIYAGSKNTGPDHNSSQLTNCTYHSEDGQSLGYYADDDFSSTDPAAVEEFCIDGFDERNT